MAESGLVLFDLNATRKCGSCTLCCTLLPVAELGKPRSTRCVHLRRTGCSIYHRRPDSCRYFQCGWLTNSGGIFAGGKLRPDHSRVVFDPMPDVVLMTYDDGPSEKITVQQLWVDPEQPDAHRAPAVRKVIAEIAARHAMPTLARIGLAGIMIGAPCLTSGRGWIEKESNLDNDRLPEDSTIMRSRC